MTNEYIPTTEEVRNRYLSEVFPEDEAEFDRWLMQVKAEAWDACWNAEPVHCDEHETYCSEYECFCDTYVNPYREVTE